MIASLNTVRVCAHHHADWDARLILWETIWNQAFSMSEIYSQFKGSGNDKKIKVAEEGIKLTTGFGRYRPKRLLFELASRKSRTLGVDQNFLIFWRPRYIYICESIARAPGRFKPWCGQQRWWWQLQSDARRTHWWPSDPRGCPWLVLACLACAALFRALNQEKLCGT